MSEAIGSGNGAAPEPLLRLESVDTFYGPIHILQGVNLEVGAGELVCLLGGNASGKSTTLKTVLGIVQPRNGSVHFDGEDVTSRSTSYRIGKGIAIVPENRRLFGPMTVLENLQMGAYLHGGGTKEAFDRVYELFPLLRDRRSQLAGTLSGGEQQMVAMGRALMSQPKLLLMDEPSMGLAPILVERNFEIIQQVHESGVAILVVEQNANVSLAIADRGYVLSTGRVVLSGARGRAPRARGSPQGLPRQVARPRTARLSRMGEGERVAVATVVATRSSAPRPVGSKLVVRDDGSIEGSVSNGCVESDVILAAQEVLAGGEPRLITYGITDEMAFGVGLAVRRRDRRVRRGADATSEQPDVTLTVVAGEDVGTKLHDPELEQAARRRGRSHVFEHEGRTVFADVTVPPPRLFVYGAADTAEALCAAAKLLGWRTIVADARPRFATPERIPSADELLAALAGRGAGARRCPTRRPRSSS